MEQKNIKIERSSEELVDAVSEALFTVKVEKISQHNPEGSMPFCNEKAIKSILQAIEAYAHIKIGDKIVFKDDVSYEQDPKKENNFYMQAISTEVVIDPKTGEKRVRKNNETTLEFKVNVPLAMLRFFKSGGDFKDREVFSRDTPIFVKDNCIGRVIERSSKFNPSKNPMFVLTFKAEFSDKFKDPKKLIDSIDNIIKDLHT